MSEIQHLACAVMQVLLGSHESSHLSVAEHMLFVDNLVVDHSILCFKLTAL